MVDMKVRLEAARPLVHRIGILKQGKMVKEILSSDVTSAELENIYLNFMKN